MRALVHDKTSIQASREQNTAGVIIDVDPQHARAERRSIVNVFEYYWALRILMHTWAYVGNFKVKSTVNSEKEVIYAPLGDLLGYADECLRRCMVYAPQNNQLEWPSDRDKATRGKAALLARKGAPMGEAITEATKELKVEWSLRGGLTLDAQPDEHRRSRSRTPPRRRDDEPSSRTKKPTFISTLPGGIAVCADYGYGKCAKKEKDCPKKRKHICGLVNPATGKACGQVHTREQCKFNTA